MAHRREIKYIIDENGCYICISHKKNEDGYPIYLGTRLHRFLYQEKYGKLDSKTVVRHKCNNRACINLEHLISGTQADNVMDSVIAKTHYIPPVKYGESHPSSILSKDTVLQIYKLKHIEHLSETKIVKFLDNIVNRATIGHVLRGETWKEMYNKHHVNGEYNGI